MKHILNSIIPFDTDDGSGGSGGGDGGSSGGGDDSKISMTQEQFDNSIKTRLTRQENSLTDKFNSDMKGLETQIKDLKTAAEKGSEDPTEIEKAVNTATQKIEDKHNLLLEAETKKADEAVVELENVKTANVTAFKQTTVVSLLSEFDVIAPNDVWTILNSEGVIGIDDAGNVIPVIRGTDQPVLGDGAKTMELRTFLKNYLSERSYFIKSSGKIGSDTKGGNANASGDKGGDRPESLSEVFASKKFQQQEAELLASGRKFHGGSTPEGFND